jgi:tetratricopeptide (TPR) repeat protein
VPCPLIRTWRRLTLRLAVFCTSIIGTAWGRNESFGIELNPSYATAQHWLYTYLFSLGRLDEAEKHLHLARKLNPFSPAIRTALALHFLALGDIDRSIKHCREAIDLEADNTFGHEHLWLALNAKGRTADAFLAYKRLLALQGYPEIASLANKVFLRSGYRAALIAAGEELSREPDQRSVATSLVAETFTLAGEPDKAFRWLDKALELRLPFMLWLRQDATWISLRSDPRFQKLLDEVERQRR